MPISSFYHKSIPNTDFRPWPTGQTKKKINCLISRIRILYRSLFSSADHNTKRCLLRSYNWCGWLARKLKLTIRLSKPAVTHNKNSSRNFIGYLVQSVCKHTLSGYTSLSGTSVIGLFFKGSNIRLFRHRVMFTISLSSFFNFYWSGSLVFITHRFGWRHKKPGYIEDIFFIRATKYQLFPSPGFLHGQYLTL